MIFPRLISRPWDGSLLRRVMESGLVGATTLQRSIHAAPIAAQAPEEHQGDQLLEYWKSLLRGDWNEEAAAEHVKDMLHAAIRLRQGKAQSTLPEQLIALFMEHYRHLDGAGRLLLFRNLTSGLGVQRQDVDAAIAGWQQATARLNASTAAASAAGTSREGRSSTAHADPAAAAAAAAEALAPAAQRLAEAVQPLYSRLFVPVSQQPCGIKFLVDLRADLLEAVKEHPAGAAPLRALGDAIRRSLAEWFSVGLLELRRLTWEGTSAALLEKVMDYEAVHRMHGWGDLHQRLGPCRRVFAFFHQAMPEEPLVVLHTALVKGPPASSMDQILTGLGNCEREPTTAIFYSISSTQKGLTGVDLGNFLIKQVAHCLLREFPTLSTLCTLSPMPGFSDWLRLRIARGLQGLDPAPVLLPAELESLLPLARLHMPSAALGESMGSSEAQQQQQQQKHAAAAALEWALQDDHWLHNHELEEALRPALLRLGAAYLVNEKRRGLALDPVANFHLRNGAALWRLNWRADTSPAGLSRSHGLMVNYLYDMASVHEHNRRYLVDGEVVAEPQVAKLLGGGS